MHMHILITCAKPLGFFVGWCWSWLGWELVHYFREALVEYLDGFEDFVNLIFCVLLGIGFKGGKSFF